ncbi:MAG: nitroreductase family protein [Candidatus Brocadiae bacterium]|nr:nitroreductase family protein [Candidatus Brocadiia bacterium]
MKYLQNFLSKLSTLLLVCLLFFIIFLQNKDISSFFQKKAAFLAPVALSDVQKIFPKAASFQISQASQEWGKVLGSSGEEIGKVVNTSPHTDSIEGYGGPVPFLIGMDLQGKIAGMLLLLNAESESFVEQLEQKKFFQNWNGLTPEEALEKKIDTVTGATITSSATIRVMQQRLSMIVGKQAPATQINLYKLIRNILAILVILFAYLSFLFPQKTNKYRTWLLISLVLVLGFLNGYSISSHLTFRWILSGIHFAARPILVIIVFLALFVHIFTNKQFYCSHVCPYGAAQELAGKIIPKKPAMPAFLKQAANHSRKIVFGMLAMLLLIGYSFDLTYIEPFSAFLYEYASWSVIALAVVFLLVSLCYPRFWCRYLCPTGQLLEVFCKVPKKEESKESKEKKSMKWESIINFLLILVIIIILIKPHLPVVSGNAASGSDALSVIHSRKSVRKYVVDKPVSKEDITTLLKAGMAAPTAADKRPWAFVVVTEREKLNALADGLPYGKMLKEAGVAIVVCGVPERMLPGKEADFWVQDCAAATQNILLAAEAIKLGAVWIGCYPLEERLPNIRKILGIPEAMIPLNVISIGHPIGIEKPKNKYDEKNIHWNQWQKQ